jgi:hypothetical protein
MEEDHKRRQDLHASIEDAFLTGRIPHLYNNDLWAHDNVEPPRLVVKAPRRLYAGNKSLFNMVMRRIEEELEEARLGPIIAVTLHDADMVKMSCATASQDVKMTIDIASRLMGEAYPLCFERSQVQKSLAPVP